MKTILVVRHGEAEGNLEFRFIGQSDVPLSTEGKTQALALVTRLAGAKIDRIVSSDLIRSFETVEPLAAHHGLEVMREVRLREIANGEWTGKLPEEIASTWPELWERYLAGEDVKRPQGEQWSMVASRVLEVVHELEETMPEDSTTVLATHGGPALILVHWALGLRAEGNIFRRALRPLANGSISTIHLPGPLLAGYNDVGHVLMTPTEGTPYFSP